MTQTLYSSRATLKYSKSVKMFHRIKEQNKNILRLQNLQKQEH